MNVALLVVMDIQGKVPLRVSCFRGHCHLGCARTYGSRSLQHPRGEDHAVEYMSLGLRGKSSLHRR